jgi:uncharacterized protein (TIGR02246 family)
MPRIGAMHLIEASDEVAEGPAATIDTFLTAMRQGDANAAASVYDEDALLLSPTGDVLRGRAAIERFWQSGIEIGLGSVEFRPRSQSAWGALLCEHGLFQMLMTPVADQPSVERGQYLIVHVQSQGSWRWAVSAFGAVDAQHEQETRHWTTGRNET